jgi:hypothetical protein
MREQCLSRYRKILFAQLKSEKAVQCLFDALKKWRIVEGDAETRREGVLAQLGENNGELRRLIEAPIRGDVGEVSEVLQNAIDLYVLFAAEQLNNVAAHLRNTETAYNEDHLEEPECRY